MPRIGKDGKPTPALTIRVASETYDLVQSAAAANGRAMNKEVEARLVASFSAPLSGSDDRRMLSFWAWFDGLSDATQDDTPEGDMLALIRRRLEHATGTRAEVVAPQPPKLVQSA